MKKSKKKGEVAYLAMIRKFPLRPIRNDAESAEACKILDKHFIRDDLDDGESDYVRALAILVDNYDREHHPVDTSSVTPLKMLKHLMEQSGMTTADLGRLLGNSGLASMILDGKRSISKANAKVLAKRFGLDAGLFI